ncbi:hypothetical protein [Chitinophaga deserti]|uniref:hypothetical protein n=1 Tax=Chitinophaga deserti TaxID=2164099 RepID=UPI000D6D89F3|nr:hypothetical protein [Chitinophaga deserti]
MYKALIIPIIILLSTGCKQGTAPDTTGFPPEVRLDSSMRTVFVPVPEHPGEPGDNIIYAASFAIAWDELSRILGSDPASVNPLVRRLNTSTSHQGALRSGNYSTEAQVLGDDLLVSAFFKKDLPFAVPFQRKPEGMTFGKKAQVRAFGMPRYMEAQAAQMQVLFYEDDDKFILRLTAGPENDEILLAKGFADGEKLNVMESKVLAAVGKGKQELAKKKNTWKYTLGPDDDVLIPEIRFHLSCSFHELINLPVTVRGQTLRIVEAAQRTAFVLDEKGVILESEAVAVAVSVPEVTDNVPVKRLHFDKPFLILMQEQAGKHPYFMMKVANAECLVKEGGALR